MAKRGFDPKCAELARYFLPNEATEDEVRDLAQAIQDAVEDQLEDPR